MTDSLNICETFYSIQGEGKTNGIPAIFLRLSGCNLICKGFASGCDTYPLWLENKKTKITTLINDWQQQGWLEKLHQGAHLVITGGEPLLQQPELIKFIANLDKETYIEIETNATIKLEPQLSDCINQINASPKLSSSGNPKQKAYQPEVITQLASLPQANFKFVVNHKNDIEEVVEQYVKPFSLDPSRIWLMPEGNTAAAVKKNSSMVISLCKKHLMNFSPRLQISLNCDLLTAT